MPPEFHCRERCSTTSNTHSEVFKFKPFAALKSASSKRPNKKGATESVTPFFFSDGFDLVENKSDAEADVMVERTVQANRVVINLHGAKINFVR